jgi:hypothetical protein
VKINKEWHQKNKMPKNPTLEERIKWHIEHAKNCTCREMPDSIRKEIENLTTSLSADKAGKAGRKKESLK